MQRMVDYLESCQIGTYNHVSELQQMVQENMRDKEKKNVTSLNKTVNGRGGKAALPPLEVDSGSLGDDEDNDSESDQTCKSNQFFACPAILLPVCKPCFAVSCSHFSLLGCP